MSNSLPVYLAALVALAAAIARTVTAPHRRPIIVHRLLTAAIATFGVSLALSAPATLAAAEVIDPFPNATRLLGNLLWMVSAFLLATMLACANEGAHAYRRVRRYSIMLTIAACAMAMLLLDAHAQSANTFASTSGRAPTTECYLAIFYSYLAWAQIRLVFFIRRYDLTPQVRPQMRRAFQLTLFAAGLGLAWAAWQIVELTLLTTLGYVAPARTQTLVDLSPAAVSLGTAACIFAAFATTLAERLETMRARVAHLRLRPLWSLLISAQPEFQLPPMAPRSSPRYRLYRRLVEIRDAQIALSAHVPAGFPQQAAQLAADHRASRVRTQRITEAACLLVALDAHQAGRAPHRAAPASNTTWPADAMAPRPLDEAASLIRLYRAMRHDQLVARLRRHVQQVEKLQPLPLTHPEIEPQL